MEDEQFLKLKAIISLVALAIATLYFVWWRLPSSRKKQTDWKTELSSTKINNTETSNSTTRNDVWSERRKRGVTAAASSTNRSSSKDNDKPFGSSYYYAHNNPNATGGYKDGLAMEDYTMNGPRLLSKSSGVVTSVPASTETSTDASEPKEVTERPTSTASKKANVVPAVKRISKFQWDDPGDANGIATIRIDTLPGATITETISWREANISDVQTTLIDDKQGLLIELQGKDDIRYRLQIQKLFGKVEEVRHVVKPSRLLVRVHKTKSWMSKSNLKAWPHP